MFRPSGRRRGGQWARRNVPMAIRMSLLVAIVLAGIAGCQTPSGPRGKLAEANSHARNAAGAPDRASNLQIASPPARPQSVAQNAAAPPTSLSGPALEIQP